MIPGYNHNVKYKDRVYHVQTEDSGVENPHIITHLFVGGNIIESLKTSYADIVQSVNLSELLVDLMQMQHKNMLKDLVRGKFDHKIAERSVNAATLNGPAPLNVDAGAQHRSSFGFGGGAAPSKPEAAQAKASPTAAPSAAKPSVPIPVPPMHKAPPPPVAPAAVATAPAAEAAPSSFFGTAPPAGGKVLEASALEAAFDSKDDKAVDSIFGNLISEKSLDEVILSYLADDKR